MRRSTLLIAGLASAAAVALAGTALASGGTLTDPTDDLRTDLVADLEVEGGTDVTPAAVAVEAASTSLSREVAEPDEGPGTTTVPSREVAEPDEGPGTTTAPSREVAEPYEGPGTVDEPIAACVHLDGREVCDTFGESDEGPGTR